MHRNLHSPTKLTEFARDSEEEPDTLLGKLVNKLTSAYNTGYNTVNLAPSPSASQIIIQTQRTGNSYMEPGTSTSSTNISNEAPVPIPSSSSSSSLSNLPASREPSMGDSSQSVENLSNASTIEHVNANDTRTPTGILTRIRSLGAMKNSNLTNYRDTDLQKFWMPDSKSKECYECCQKFTTFRRKHHCRLCGQIFCAKCCSQVVPGKIIKCTGSLKVCTYCSKVVLSYLKSSDINVDLQSDLQALQDDLSSKLSEDNSDISHLEYSIESPQKRKVSVGYQEERLTSCSHSSLSNADRKSILQQSHSLKTLYEEMYAGLPVQSRGTDLIKFMISRQKASNKPQSVAILLALIEAGFVVSILPETASIDFDEDRMYRLAQMEDLMTGSAHSFQLDLHLEANSALLSRPLKSPSSHTIRSGFDYPSLDNSMTINTNDMQSTLLSTVGSKPLLEAYCSHEEQLIGQLLRAECLDQKWAKILIALCAHLANRVTPNFVGMDIRNVINFKKVPGGERVESAIIGGVVISKHVAHKAMATHIPKPRILLLQCPVVHQRREGKYASLDILMMQEEEHLRNVTERIMCLKPNVVLVHKNVSRIAQDMLRDRGITLVLDVKLSVLERLARTLDCDLVTNIDSNIGRPRLGTCEMFQIRRFENELSGEGKTLMYFEVAAAPKNFCVLLRGGSSQELTSVKRVAAFLTYARYNWRFELSFLLDIFAIPPLPKEDMYDSTETSPMEKQESKRPTSTVVPRVERRSEESRNVVLENVKDFSDPLRNTDLSASVFEDEHTLAVETPYDNRFKTALISTVLSISPFIIFPLPYLETESGRKCVLRSRFPNELYYSLHWSEPVPVDKGRQVELKLSLDTPLLPPHPFVTHKITTSIDNRELQNLLARFRACGTRLPKTNCMIKKTKRSTSSQKSEVDQTPSNPDALAIENHQHLSILFCSYYSSPQTTPPIGQKHTFCTQPVVLDMHFYGENDIMLGQFLENYCFRFTYICKWCSLPMIGHSKRYVHSMGSIQVYITGEPKPAVDPNSQIFVSTHCDSCQETSPSVPMSYDSKCLSLAKYFEMRFHGHAYKRRRVNVNDPLPETSIPKPNDNDHDLVTCTHSLHRDLIHNFTYNGITAHFKYIPITVWEIYLPPLIIRLPEVRICDQIQPLYESVKALSQNGYEVYVRIYERLAQLCSDTEVPLIKHLKDMLNEDQMMFKSRIEVVHTLLTEKVGGTLWEVNDAILMAKRALADSVEVWGPRLQDAAVQMKTLLKAESQSAIDTGTICTEDLRPETLDDDDKIRYDSDDNVLDAPTSSGTGQQSTQTKASSRKSVEEKKTRKSIWNQLMSSSGSSSAVASPIPPNEHHTLPLGAFPVPVNDQDLSSIIAHTLISCEYRRGLEQMQAPAADISGSPSLKRKSHNIDASAAGDEEGSDRTDQSKAEEKRNKSHSHCEVQFHDVTTSFTCKLYFAKEFEAMRSSYLHKNRNEGAERRASSNSLSPKQTEKVESRGKINMDAWKSTEAEDIRKEFARSLSQSVPWEAKGGKSGSHFSQTIDKRFVLKEMSKTDVAIFQNFAPNYFEYIDNCLQLDQPTLLAKIFGVFKIGVKKKDSEERNVLVMENLFYNRRISNKFDLKGSERNRLADPIDQQQGEIVLLDQNLMQMAWSNPLYILAHSRHVLRDTIERDASFLERNDVMDYSLLVGLDSDENLLVLGIIDYIRTYTFDKKLESLVKQSGLLGGHGKAPTIINPKNYKQRFTEAMEKYFLVVPDRWQGLSKKQ